MYLNSLKQISVKCFNHDISNNSLIIVLIVVIHIYNKINNNVLEFTIKINSN